MHAFAGRHSSYCDPGGSGRRGSWGGVGGVTPK
jgi:hypothetical protein